LAGKGHPRRVLRHKRCLCQDLTSQVALTATVGSGAAEPTPLALLEGVMEPSEWYKKRLAEIEDNPSYICEKKLLKTQELVLEQAERIEKLELRMRQQHSPGCLAARERRKNIKRWEPFTDCNCD